MSFNFIIDPATLESYSIFSKQGVALLKKYVKDYQTGGSGLTPEDESNQEDEVDEEGVLTPEDEDELTPEDGDESNQEDEDEFGAIQTLQEICTICNNNDNDGDVTEEVARERLNNIAGIVANAPGGGGDGGMVDGDGGMFDSDGGESQDDGGMFDSDGESQGDGGMFDPAEIHLLGGPGEEETDEDDEDDEDEENFSPDDTTNTIPIP